MSYITLHGNVIDELKTLDDNCIDAIITDPPYNLGMDKWDTWPSNKEFGDWCHEWGKEAYRVLKPEGKILSFGAGRTYHWMAMGLETAGFNTRDMIEWVYWATMPRGKNLKSCHEPIFFGSKGKHAPLNVDECRVPLTKAVNKALMTTVLPNMPTGKHPGRKAYGGDGDAKKYKKAIDDKPYKMNESGRHPFNIITPDIVDNMEYPSNIIDTKKPRGKESISGHQTQKPVALMQWLISLTTQPGDLVLDCFGGTGTTGEACLLLDRSVILIEQQEEYVDIINERLENV